MLFNKKISALIIGGVALDQLTKQWAFHQLSMWKPLTIIPGVLEFQLVKTLAPPTEFYKPTVLSFTRHVGRHFILPHLPTFIHRPLGSAIWNCFRTNWSDWKRNRPTLPGVCHRFHKHSSIPIIQHC